MTTRTDCITVSNNIHESSKRIGNKAPLSDTSDTHHPSQLHPKYKADKAKVTHYQPIPTLENAHREMLTQLRLRATRRDRVHQAVYREASDAYAFLDAQTHTTPILCRHDSGVRIIHLAHQRIILLIQQTNRLCAQERRDRALKRRIWSQVR
ncbi:hypothetical protein N7501_008021 [Penicillium viridicatum]|nr:hypothetical protein N7501_008021 [Penicillium viridicatum]